MAKVKEIEVGVGLSLDKGGAWLKGNTLIRVSLESGDDVQECIKRAFEIADDTLTEKMELLGSDEDESDNTQRVQPDLNPNN